MMRLLCRIFGCYTDHEGDCGGHACERCGAGYYEDCYCSGAMAAVRKYIYPAESWWRAVKRFLQRRCEVCGKRIFAARWNKFTCPGKCADEWIPF